ncbi:MAG: HEAT repeat domain-containing protein [Nitrospirae bacterium]|nr:HEAT repeat domain-containing protein [Nitrospirota bacterium]
MTEREGGSAGDRGEEERWQQVHSLPPDGKHVHTFLRALADPGWRVRKVAADKIVACPQVEDYLDEVVRGLHAQDNAGLRNSSVEVLIGIGAPAVSRLVREIASGDVDVRKFIADILGEIGGPTSERALARLLRDSDENVSFASAEALGKLGTATSRRILEKEWMRPSLRPLVRVSMLDALASTQSVVPLREIEKCLDDPLLARPAVRLLAHHRSPRALDLLVRVLAQPKESLRQAALLSLDRILERCAASRIQATVQRAKQYREPAGQAMFLALPGWLRSEDTHVQFAAARVVSHLGLKELASHLLEIVSSEQGALVARRSLERLGRDAVRGLSLVFPGLSGEKRAFVLELFGDLELGGVRPLVEGSLDDPDPLVRAAAARALGQLGDRAGISRLMQALLQELEDSVLEKLVDALIRLAERHREAVLAEVEPRLKDGDRAAFAYLIRLLGHCGQKRHVENLAVLLQDPSPAIRRETLSAMAELDDPQVRRRVIAFLNDDEPENRALACRLLARLGGSDGVQSLQRMADDKNWWVRLEAVRGLAGLRGQGEPARSSVLAKALLDPIGPVAIFAFEEISKHDPKAALGHLGPVLTHLDPRVQAEALRIMERNGLDPTRTEVRSRAAVLNEQAKEDWLRWVARARKRLPRPFLDELSRSEKSPQLRKLVAQLAGAAGR